MKQSQIFCYILLMCLVTLFVVVLIAMDSFGTSLSTVAGIDAVRTSSGRRKVVKKIKVRRLSSGELVDMRGRLVLPEALAHNEFTDKESTLTNHSVLSGRKTTNVTHTKLERPSVNSHILSAKPPPQSPLLEDIRKISQSTNIDERGRWQTEQVNKYCARYKKRKLALTLPGNTHSEFITRRNLFRHLIFDDERKLIFCFIPKVGCTNMRRFLFVLQGIIPKESVKWRHVSEEDYLGPGVQKASFLNYSLTESERLHKLQNYWKFIIIRNPLERLLSAFINKLSSPIDFNSSNMDTFELHKRTIMEKYQLDKIKKSLKNGITTLNLDFETYLKWIVDTPNYKLNEHFAPIVDLSQPCRIRYNFYGNFKMYSSDMKAITARLHVPHEWFVDKSSHKHGRDTKDLMVPFYSVVSNETKQRLVKDIWRDLDFYYSLYPEETGSHNQILGLMDS